MTIVLGGGQGTRLNPLTKYRSKPAVPLGGKYRLIDIPISNCLNSGLNRIYLLTQFNSVSLHRHIRQTYSFDTFDGGFVEILAAQQTLQWKVDWYQGTADAVRKNLRYIEQPGIDYVLILSGDQLYRMDYREMLKTHQDAKADATISTVPVFANQAYAFGILQFDDSGRVIGFKEKPKTEEELNEVRTTPEWIDDHGLDSRGRDCLANMGIYLFNRDMLVDLLKTTDYQDFGKEVFPSSIQTHRVQVHLFDGYWEDIGTIRSFFDANLGLVDPKHPFRLIEKDAPIYTRARYLPPTRIEGANIRRSLIADGCLIEEGAEIENCVIGLRCRIGKNAKVRNSFVMGADFYQEDDYYLAGAPVGGPELGVGPGAVIDGAIIDKNCQIGKNARIQPFESMESDTTIGNVTVRDGIIVVPKDATIPDDWQMTP